MGTLSTKSVRLDGSNEHINIGNVAALDFERTNSFSVSCWVLLYSTGAQTLISKMTGATTNRGWSFEIGSSGYLQFSLYNDFTGANRLSVRTTAVIPAGAVMGAYQSWHHVVVTYDGSSTAAGVKFYIDGVEITSKTTIYNTLSATIVGTAVAHIGRRDDGAAPLYLNGNIDEVAVYNITLSGAQVTTIFNSWDPPDLTVTGPTGNLVGYWKIGDGDAYPTATDSSSSGNNGTYTNTESTDIEAFAPGQNAMDIGLANASTALAGETLFGGGGKDLTPPSITNVSPASPSSIARTASISFDVTDITGFTRIVVQAQRSSGRVDVVHDGTSFRGNYTGSRTPISNGYTYSISESVFGWPQASLTIRVFAVDADGNESSPTDFPYTITNPQDPIEVVIHYKMRALADPGPGFVTWVVPASPDFAGTYAGSAIQAGTAVVVSQWEG